jgi:hypothetical protein
MQSFRRKAAFLLVLIVTAGLMAPAWALARCVAAHDDTPPPAQAMNHADHSMHHAPAAKDDCGHHCIVVIACAAACFGVGMPAAPDAVTMPSQRMSFDRAPYSAPTARIVSPEPHPPRHARI